MASPTIRPATGTLGILTPGLGAVATTFMAGVESIRRGHAKPIGSLTQMATIRLGKRTDNRSPLIKDFVPLAVARRPRVRRVGSDSRRRVHGREEGRRARGPRPRARSPSSSRASSRCRPCSTTSTSRASTARTSRRGRSKRDLAEQLRQDMRDFKAKHKCDRLVIVWCASTEIFIKPGPQHATIAAVREGDGAERRDDLAVDALRVGRDHGGRAVLQRRAEPGGRHAGAAAARQRHGRADLRQGLQDRPDAG